MMPFHVLLLVLYISNFIVCHAQLEESVYWEIKNQTGILDGQSLRLRKVIHPTNTYHSCYEVSCEGSQCTDREDNSTTIQVCYPALVVSGLSKCGTSAMYDLLSKFPRTIKMREKENCPFKRQEPLWSYFHTLPRMSEIGERNITIDGCLNRTSNMVIRKILHDPHTYHILMVRNYADRWWSAYNFWCKKAYRDSNCTHASRWVDPSVHKRSPELFHSYLLSDKDEATVDPCVQASTIVSKAYQQLQSNRQHNHTIVVANEELDVFPLRVAQRIASFVNYNIDGINITSFGNVRVNAQEHKGTNSSTSKDKYLPGRYNISHYQPLLPASRTMINKCWHEDCIALSKIPPYYKYTACHPEHNVNNTRSAKSDEEKRLIL